MLELAPKSIGLRIADIDIAEPGWRDDFAWPVRFGDLFDASHRLHRRQLDLLASLDGAEREVSMLARPIGHANALLDAAFAVQSEPRAGVRLTGPPEIEVLRGELAAPALARSSLVNMGARFLTTDIPRQWLRRLARVKSWSTPAHLLATVLAPQGVAVTHNPLLVAEARAGNTRLGFRHAAPWLDTIVRRTVHAQPLLTGDDHVTDLARRIAACLADDRALDDAIRERLQALLVPVVTDAINKAAAALAALRGHDRLPDALWSGTGGFYPARALGLEVKRRGGRVVRFDHGGTMNLLDEPDFVAHQEMAVSTDFVVPSPAAAKTRLWAEARTAARPFGAVALAGANGDPALDPRHLAPPRPVAAPRPLAATRPKVMFVAGAYYGFNQTFPPFPPAPVYLDWHHEILAQLGALPIELVHKPHPGGLFMGAPPGLDHLAPIERRPFEQVMAEADLFVFDLAASTTFSLALSSDRPIVLLDFGCLHFGADIAPDIRARCRIVPIHADTRNRARVDAGALEEAVLGSAPAPDPTPFRRLFLAEP